MENIARHRLKPVKLEIEVEQSARVLTPRVKIWNKQLDRHYRVFDSGGDYKVGLLPKEVQEKIYKKQESFANHGMGFVPPDWIGPDYRAKDLENYGN